jgi:hypothetical protein
MRHAMLLLTLCCALSGRAHAQDVDLVALDRTASAGRVGLVGGIAGPPMAFGGLLLMSAGAIASSEELVLGGFSVLGSGAAGILVGPPLQAGSAMRGARLSGADRQLGAWAWGLWGMSMASGSLGTVAIESGASAEVTTTITSLVFTGGYVGSLVTGAAQHRRNREVAGASLSLSPPSPRLEVALLPSRQGLTLAGRF